MTKDAASPLLSIRRLSKHFGGAIALQSVDVDFHAGEVHALLGENGAGKSTLIKILAGVYRPDEGEVAWRGDPIHLAQDRSAIAFIHQDLGLVDEMTVGENIGLVAGYPIRRGGIDWKAVAGKAAGVLKRMGGEIAPEGASAISARRRNRLLRSRARWPSAPICSSSMSRPRRCPNRTSPDCSTFFIASNGAEWESSM